MIVSVCACSLVVATPVWRLSLSASAFILGQALIFVLRQVVKVDGFLFSVTFNEWRRRCIVWCTLDSGLVGVYRYRSGTVKRVQLLAAYAHTYIHVCRTLANIGDDRVHIYDRQTENSIDMCDGLQLYFACVSLSYCVKHKFTMW